VWFAGAHRPDLVEGTSMSRARDPMQAVTERKEIGREAPMVVTPSALLRLLRWIFGHAAQR
jgi:hypothetical protein